MKPLDEIVAVNDRAARIAARGKVDTVGKIIAYEAGEMDTDERLDFFQHLIDNNIVNVLQGSYQREAARLIAAGQCVAR